jgi:hypothetical protein
MVISLGPEIEAARLPIDDQIVFSYRFSSDPATSQIFRPDFGWLVLLALVDVRSLDSYFSKNSRMNSAVA